MTWWLTLQLIGAKSVYLKRTRYEKSMISFCVAAKADGTKLKPFFVFLQKTRMESLDEEFESRCVIKSSTNAFRLLGMSYD